MNVLQALTELYNSEGIESVYRDLARKILENLEEMKRVTIYDIAELTNSSRTTVWRLVQKLGYGSFSDFRYALQSAASQYQYYNRIIEQYNNTSAEQLLDGISGQMASSSILFKENISVDLIEELTDEISCVSQIHFYIPFHTAYINSFQQNLWKDGKHTEYSCLLPDMLEAAEFLEEDSIVFFNTIEFTETQNMQAVFEKIKQKGGKIWLTGNADSSYAGYADRKILMLRTAPYIWLNTFDAFILTLSERYRAKYID